VKFLCDELCQILETHLIPSAKSSESQVFYNKMCGDANRYIAEISTSEDISSFRDKAKRSYETASKIASDELLPTHPNRLGLALNFSVFYYEIMNDPAEACRLAKLAFDDGVSALDSLSDKAYRDAAQILQLLCENLSLWNPDAASVEGTLDGSDETEFD
jgi:14-3-3 protein epsilon